ncbi:hypothetical protein ELE36_10950 [Pseudolysobacter antarcticus]|uniref:PEP-CTERM sorting domain-containing protein n=1 Tax=Pseudolysobacter antarcticus TaxID=2511995 RepID=A0A411HKA9_9GAMM|nr:hypothetical protein [Pseudolysobacter antarcticus]QBB70830.1 hypothetical protein ELE36_10950 [Pseudolysobacter antarcticus]
MSSAKQLRWLPLARTALVIALGLPLFANASPACLTENFDSAAAPALPTGWTSSVITTTGTNAPAGTRAVGYADSGTNAVWFDDYNDYADASLYSPVYAVGAVGSPSLTFVHSYTLWTADASAQYNGANNGAVLEVAINGGAYVDVVDAGGSFSAGGYNVALDPNFRSPIAQTTPYTRAVWGGDSSGFGATTVVVPPSALAGTVQFRWRLGTLGGGRGFATHSGWWIDSVQYETLGDVIFHDDFEGGVPCPH